MLTTLSILSLDQGKELGEAAARRLGEEEGTPEAGYSPARRGTAGRFAPWARLARVVGGLIRPALPATLPPARR